MPDKTSTICHCILLCISTFAIVALTLVDIKNGGDGGALAAGLAAIAAVGGFSLNSIINPPPSS